MQQAIQEKKIGKFVILNQVLGAGSQAICRKACLIEDPSQFFACKIVEKAKLKKQINQEMLKNTSNNPLARLQEEVNTLQRVNHANLVKLIEVSQTDNNIYIFMEFCNQGNLRQLKEKRGGVLSEIEVIRIFNELKEGFQELYKKNVVHRDIKPENILIHNGQIKLADFGFAKTVDEMDEGIPRTFLGTPFYIPVEMLSKSPYSSKCDVFSLGIVIFELLFGYHCFYHNKVYFTLEIFKKPCIGLDSLRIILENQYNQPLQFPQFPKVKNTNLLDLLQKMLKIYEKDRISWKEIFAHPFFEKQNQQSEKLMKQIQDENTTELQKLFFKNKQFLDKNLVQQDLLHYETKQEEQKINIINENLQYSMFIGQFDQKEIIKLYEKYNKVDQILQEMHERILYERNIAMLYSNIVQLIWKLQQQKLFVFQEEELYFFLFLMSRLGITFINNILKLVQNKSEVLNPNKELVTWFQNSNIYNVDKKLLKQDYDYIYCTMENFYNQILKIQDKITDQHFLEVFSMDITKNENQFNSLVKQYLKNIILKLWQQANTFVNDIQKKKILYLVRLLQICQKPYAFFTEKGKTDFHKFYQDQSGMPSELLSIEVKKNL